ncbi:MAG: signal peptidase II [Gammaproteobacteria bacterium]
MKWFWLTVIVIIVDQLTKYQAGQYLVLHEPMAIITGFNLTLMHNTGAAFSFLSQAGGWQRWFFIGLASVIGIGIIVWMIGLPSEKRWLTASLALILGGALGNLWDRVVLGYVVDFIEVYYSDWYWPAFNVADSAITIGAVMLIIDAFWLDDAKVSTHTR